MAMGQYFEDDNQFIRENGFRLRSASDLTHQAQWVVHDEFFDHSDTEADHGPRWLLLNGSDAQALDPALDTTQAGGVWQCITGNADGTTAADASQMIWTGVPIRLDTTGGVTVIECRLRIVSAITTVSVGFGLTDNLTTLEEPFTGATDTITSVASNAVGFLFDSANTTLEWFGCAVDGDTDDTGNGAVGVAPVADAWQILRIEISNDGVEVKFFVDGVGTGPATVANLTLSGAAGVGATLALYPYVIANATTTTSRTVDVDYVRVEGVR